MQSRMLQPTPVLTCAGCGGNMYIPIPGAIFGSEWRALLRCLTCAREVELADLYQHAYAVGKADGAAELESAIKRAAVENENVDEAELMLYHARQFMPK